MNAFHKTSDTTVIGGLSVAAPYWNLPLPALLEDLKSSQAGLDDDAARDRLLEYGANRLDARRQASALGLLVAQLRSPLVLLLAVAAGLSLLTREWLDAVIVLLIVLASSLLGFWQEYSAGRAVERLRERTAPKATVLRGGRPQAIPAASVVPGDIVLLSAGSIIPADGRIVAADELLVDQAALTGEAFPAEKTVGESDPEAGIAERTGCVFQGTSVRSGSGRAVVVQTGKRTEFGRIAHSLARRPAETQFEMGIRQFGLMLAWMMTVLVLVVFAANVLLKKPPLDSLLFAVALAVGMTPELLPAILSITLAHGAERMAKEGVLVRRLSAIENLGSMDVLCTDKTGTLTVGALRLEGALDPDGAPDDSVMRDACLNASLQTGMANALDQAICAASPPDLSAYTKVEEIPYDFSRKRLTVAVTRAGDAEDIARLITKGAFESVLSVCSRVGDRPLDAARRQELEERFAAWSDQGFRVLGVATRPVALRPVYVREDEAEMTFCGFLLFADPPKTDAGETVAQLARQGVALKVITGDSRRVAIHVASAVGIDVRGVLTGRELRAMSEAALREAVRSITLFAEVDPDQKERLVSALRAAGHVVGYLGDGINDAPALHAADVGVSVETATDVAREAADFVLLQPSLGVLLEGIQEGRRTFANTLKYLFTTTSANFGNMLSMAVLSPFLPFLPLLPIQILLNNFLSDFPALAIATDTVDPEQVARPRRWAVGEIRRFMVVFGLISSAFDALTFALLLAVLRSGEALFQTAWFIESLLTELAILLVVRTQRPALHSRPGTLLWRISLAVGIGAFALPYLPGMATLFHLVPPPLPILASVLAILVLYVLVNEAAKRRFFPTIAGEG